MQRLNESVRFWHFCPRAEFQQESCADLGGHQRQGGTLKLPTNLRLTQKFELHREILT